MHKRAVHIDVNRNGWAYNGIETVQHLLQPPPLVLEIRFETIKKHGHVVLQIALLLHLSLGGFTEATVNRIAGLEHLHAPVELHP